MPPSVGIRRNLRRPSPAFTNIKFGCIYATDSSLVANLSAAAGVLIVIFHLINPVVTIPVASADMRFHYRRLVNGSLFENMALSRNNDVTGVGSAKVKHSTDFDAIASENGFRQVDRVDQRKQLPSQPSTSSSQSRHRSPGGDQYVQRLPDAIIIGAKKSGTRALLEFLRAHPDVRAPGPEIHFFDKNYDKSLDWYRSQMPFVTPGQLTIEKTPSYFITRAAPGRVYNMSSSIRLILVVRDPVTRAISDYTQAIAKRPDLGSFERRAFVGDDDDLLVKDRRGRQSVDASWGVIKIGLYARHLERWLQYFPLKQIHLVHGERLITDPVSELNRVQDFLGLRRVITAEHFSFNTTKGFPCLRKSSTKSVLERDDHVTSRGQSGATGVVERRSSSLRCLGKTKGRTHPDIDERVLDRLRQFYRPYNSMFYQMTGMNFDWT